MTDSERHSFSQGRFEEVLGSLSRQLSDPDRVTATVSNLLAVPDDPELDQHRTILRLSRDLDNRISVVTTNFDTLLERAAVKEFTNDEIANISFAGQSIPAPGSAAFSGIIHIHGRLADRALELESTPLVLSSADYGDAYMRSGWVSRFLFDLARCKTIVLVGYSASDAPVRYFLNVLEADRIRFPDLKPVYAFDAYEHDPKEASTAWGTLAVTPLPYRKAGPHDHSPLWRDLAALGKVVDRPRRWRTDQASDILDRTVADTDTKVREKLRWLLGGHHDLWSAAIKTISDPKWFAVFKEERLWSHEEAAFVIAGWIARDFEDPVRLKCACEWQRRLGSSFTAAVEQRLIYLNEVDRIWLRIWQIFCLVDPPIELSKKIHKATRRLKSDVTVYGDLERAVRLLAPALVLDESDNETVQPITRLSDVVRPRMRISDSPIIHGLIDALCDKQEYALCTVAGNPEKIVEAARDDRLRVASELRRRPEPEHWLGWSKYCRSDPQGAFDLLANADLSSANGTLWNDFLVGIKFGHESSKTVRDDLAVKSFGHLADARDESLCPMASGLTSLLMFGPRYRVAGVDRWLRRLWDISIRLQSPWRHSTHVYELAIQEDAGMVAETLLSEIHARKQNDSTPTAAQLELLSDISHHEGTPGRLGRMILAYHLSFVIRVSQPRVVDVLKDRIVAPDEEGKALRAVMLSNRITAEITRKLRDAVLKGAIESKAVDDGAEIVADNFLRPALSPVPGDWGLTASDVASLLRRASQSIRIGALEVLRRWIDESTNAELFWRDKLLPFFDDVWPKERGFLDASLTDSFIGVVIAAGNEFPAALKRLKPYMVPFDGGSHGLHYISSSQAPKTFPEDVLSLLWRTCGPDSGGTFYNMAEIIDRLIKAEPKLEVDRRLQWLEHRGERYN